MTQQETQGFLKSIMVHVMDGLFKVFCQVFCVYCLCKLFVMEALTGEQTGSRATC